MEDTTKKAWPQLGRGIARGRPTFLTRSATDDAEQLQRRSSLPPVPGQTPSTEAVAFAATGQHSQQVFKAQPKPIQRHDSASQALENVLDGQTDGKMDVESRNNSRQGKTDLHFHGDSLSPYFHLRKQKEDNAPKSGAPRPVGGTQKLNTLSGVFIPTSLNVFSILMFIRFGFILGQSGVFGIMGMLVAAYLIDLVTTMSISAVASNGTVRGGGAYYLISRSLGPEFGGAIGIVSYLGFVFNTGMNAVGLIDCLLYNFGTDSGNWSNTMPEAGSWQYLWSTVVVLVCVGICLAGSAIFARISSGLLVVLLIAIISIPISALVLQPFKQTKQYVHFTGLSVHTLRENLLPHFTKGAAGSKVHGRENFQDLFGVLFPATCGILAGASMSGDLKNPSRSIPKGTLGGLGITFVAYTLVILSLAASITRESLYKNVNVIQDTNASGILILAGEIASSFFSALMGIIGPSKQLQAIARDNTVPGLSIFGQGMAKSDTPVYAIILTLAVTQLVLLLDINSIASLVTMAYLMTFFALNVATFLLKIGSAPNFRPSFQYFSWASALFGALLSVVSMFFVDGLAASGSICILLLLIAVIHYTTPPKPWGAISEALIYHQVRKYLLRLRTEHVKFWRPQILLFVNDPRRGYKLIQFCNSLKKGGLYILGHVIVTTNFGASVPEARKQQAAWTKYIDFSHIKAFVNVAISPSIEWGARNIVLSAGLGGMRPNIVVFGLYNLQQFRSEQPLVDVPSPPPERKQEKTLRSRKRSKSGLRGDLPTDVCIIEQRTDVQSYVMVLEDMLLSLRTNVAIAAGFSDLELPNAKEGVSKKYIDLWPIQMSAEVSDEIHGYSRNVRTTNFDTYTMILQLGCILNTVPSWKRTYRLRVAVFVEYESDVEEERIRVRSLLESLRIQGEVIVFWLASGDVKSYELIVNGIEVDQEVESRVGKLLEDEHWFTDLQTVRGKVRSGDISNLEALSLADDVQWPTSSFQERENSLARLGDLRKMLLRPGKRASFSNISNAGLSLSMRTSRIDDDMLSRHASHPSDSEYSESDGESTGTSSYADDDEVMESEDDPYIASMDDVSASKTKSKASSSKRSSRRSSRTDSPLPKKSSRASSYRSKSSRKLLGETSGTATPALADEQEPLLQFDQDALARPRDQRRGRRGLSPEDAESSRSPHTRAASPNFSSDPTPLTKIASQEGAGPSIMFAEDPHPRRREQTIPEIEATKSIYQRQSDPSPPKMASGYPVTGSVPISFNTLPSRAQHLILNDLMAQNSDDTAVIFTTLPAPVEGTFKSETDSLTYVSDLEVLIGGLPPTLLVHSNSMTVTMNL